MFDGEQFNDWYHQDVVDLENHPVGVLEEVYGDNYGTSSGFACVKTGLFGRRLTFVPLEGASWERDHVRVAYLAEQIKRAPSVEPDGALTADEETALFEHYGLNSSLDATAPPPPQARVESPRLVRHYTREDAENIATARELAGQGALGGGRYPGMAGGIDALADRLRALEERVAELESRFAR